MNPNEQHYLHAASRRVIIGRDPEYADMVNVEGIVTADRHYVEAVNARGEVFGHDYTSDDRDEIAQLLGRMERKLADGGKLDPAHWHYDRLSYGADGWDQQELEAEIRDAENAGELHPMRR